MYTYSATRQIVRIQASITFFHHYNISKIASIPVASSIIDKWIYSVADDIAVIFHIRNAMIYEHIEINIANGSNIL